MELLLSVLALACISAGLSCSIAYEKGWGSSNWLLAGLLFGPLGLIAAAGLPDRKLRHYLLELSKQQGVSPQLLEPQQLPPANADKYSFAIDGCTTDDELWDLFLSCLPDSFVDLADKNASKLDRLSTKMLVSSADGRCLADATCVHRTSQGTSYWRIFKI